MRAQGAEVIERAVAAIEGLPQAPSRENNPSKELLERLAQPPGDTPGDFSGLLDLATEAAEKSFLTSGPSYLAYIPGGGLYASALADLMANVWNRYTGKVTPAPALVALEESVLRWMCDLFRLGPESQGLLTTGGSISSLIAIVAARTRHAEGNVDRARVYVGEHGHGCMVKAARTAGIRRDHIRMVDSDDGLRMRPEHLRRLVEADLEGGLIPACICASAGTTDSGAVDPLHEIAALADEFGVWYHVDGAYGGLFQLTDRGRGLLDGIERADSITLDPHKTLFLPFGTGALVVRSRDALRRAFSQDADYLQDLGQQDVLPDFDLLSPELSRDFRGLRVWLPLHLHGVQAFRDQLNEKLDLANEAWRALLSDPRLEVPWRPDLTVVVFRKRGGSDAEQLEWLERINSSGRVLLSSTRIQGQVWLRIAILSFRTHRDRVEEALEIIRGAL